MSASRSGLHIFARLPGLSSISTASTSSTRAGKFFSMRMRRAVVTSETKQAQHTEVESLDAV